MLQNLLEDQLMGVDLKYPYGSSKNSKLQILKKKIFFFSKKIFKVMEERTLKM
jgi:hypothetical protein